MRRVRSIYYSFPVRLLMLHFRNHMVLIAVWVVLSLFCTGMAGRLFGMHYLMLTPEYLGEVGFWSYFLTGAAFGAIYMIWNLTAYLLCSYRFPFLATLEAPFTKFSLNNSLIPIGFLGVYIVAAIWFQAHDELIKGWEIARNLTAFLSGSAVFVLLIAGYLQLTNKDIAAFLRPGEFVPRPGGVMLTSGQRLPSLGEIRAGFTRWRVDTYLTERLHIRWVRSVAHYDQALIGKVFRQNHLNAVVVQCIALILLMLQGWFIDSEWLRFPSAVSVFIIAGIVMSVFGALTFWFRQWATLVFAGMLIVINFLTSKGYFHYQNQAYGLNYAQELRPDYNYATLQNLINDSILIDDKAATEQILHQWLVRRTENTSGKKPKIVFVCTSGGGMRAALWTMRVLQKGDISTSGNLLRQTMLISGASGGMLGAGYLREIMLRQAEGDRLSVHDSLLLDDMGADLLNPVTSAMVSNDLFYPMGWYETCGQTYRKDRGYLFEAQLRQNLRGYMSRRLIDYRQPEREATIPMMVISPFIVNDARRLLISAQDISYLMRPPDDGRYSLQPEIDGVEFRRLFARQQADSLHFTTALRMNSTFPFILPNTWLPTQPKLEILDAGARDNFGITAAARFIHVFREWISKNTSGVVIVQIRSWEKIDPIPPNNDKGIIEGLFTPAGAAANLTTLQDFDHDNTLALLDDLLGRNRLEVVRFVYRPVRKQREASLSLHLSKREKIDLREAWWLPENQAALRQLQRALK